ncbi:MAG TPA: hypothetical protein VN655_12370 [Pseudolabrys sp.]|nr:hypothetical protein [Pseudolabrys sp.]
MSISSIGIQTVTPTTGTKQEQQPPQQQSAANDNSSQTSTKGPSPSQTTGKYVDKRV